MITTLDLANVSANPKNAAHINKFGSDYAFIHFNSGNISTRLPEAFKVNGVTIILCVAGEVSIRLNFKDVTMKAGSLVSIGPETLVEMKRDDLTDIEGYAIFLAPQFISNISFDLNVLNYKGMSLDQPPVIELDEEQQRLLVRHFLLLDAHAEYSEKENVYTLNAARSLMAATIYQLMGMAMSKPEDEKQDQPKKRGQIYVEKFQKLIHENFRNERSVAFYAEKLFISPKYLSLIIKEATGATASEWIDRLVLLEAKNLLRYSGLNIQQIAYQLNFSNQSSFGKYFKHLTGLSPSEFRHQ